MVRIGRWAVLSAVVGMALMIRAILTGGNRPDATASGATVQAFYAANRSSEEASIYLVAFAFMFILFFYGTLHAYARPAGVCSG